MRKSLAGLLGAAALIAIASPAAAQGTVKVGIILSLSGQFADAGAQMLNGVKTYMQEHGDTVGGKKIELIVKDTGGVAPDVGRRDQGQAHSDSRAPHYRLLNIALDAA